MLISSSSSSQTDAKNSVEEVFFGSCVGGRKDWFDDWNRSECLETVPRRLKDDLSPKQKKRKNHNFQSTVLVPCLGNAMQLNYYKLPLNYAIIYIYFYELKVAYILTLTCGIFSIGGYQYGGNG